MRFARPRVEQLVGWLAAVLLGVTLFGRSLFEHVKGGLDPFVYADDVRVQVMGQLRWAHPEVFQNDFIGDYALAITPLGLQVLYRLGSVFFDPSVISGFMPYPLLFVTAWALSRTSARLAPAGVRGVVAFASVCLVLGAEIYLQRMAGTCARAFGFPIVALGLLAVVEGHLFRGGVVAALGALFYPTGSVVVAGAIFSVLFLSSPSSRGLARTWSFGRRGLGLLFLSVAILLAVTPTLLATSRYGPRVTASNRAIYPEAGPGGTHGPEDRPPYDGFLDALETHGPRGLLGAGRPFIKPLRERVSDVLIFDVALLLALAGFLVSRRGARGRRFWSFVLGAGLAHLAARVLEPYLYAPSRFAMYAVPPLVAVFIPVGLAWLGHRWTSHLHPRLSFVSVSAMLAVLLGFAGGLGSRSTGLSIRLDEEQQALYLALGTLPKDALVAGWPDDPMSNVPWVSRRRAYMTGEMHIAFHAGYLERVRARLDPFFRAYTSPDPAGLRRLRDERGVTHVLVEKKHFLERRQGYMPPFGTTLAQHWRALGRRTPALLAEQSAVIFESPRYLVVDLAHL